MKFQMKPVVVELARAPVLERNSGESHYGKPLAAFALPCYCFIHNDHMRDGCGLFRGGRRAGLEFRNLDQRTFADRRSCGAVDAAR